MNVLRMFILHMIIISPSRFNPELFAFCVDCLPKMSLVRGWERFQQAPLR